MQLFIRNKNGRFICINKKLFDSLQNFITPTKRGEKKKRLP